MSDFKVGDLIEYAPSLGGPWFRGVVAEEPRMFNPDTKVVRLRDMDPAYDEYTGRRGRTTVAAASVYNVRLRADSLDQLRRESIEWANRTFTQANRHSKAAHLLKEAGELLAAPNDVEEMADIFILLAHISDGVDLVGAVRAKLEKNKLRKWGTPDADGVVEHVEEGAAS